VSLVNNAFHYVLLPAAQTITCAEKFKRFIDSIVWLSNGLNNTNQIRETLTHCFENMVVMVVNFILDS